MMRGKTLAKISEYFFEQILRTLFTELISGIVLNDSNSLDINVQDQHTRAFDTSFYQLLGTATLSADLAEDAYSFTATPGHGIEVGDRLHLYNTILGRGFRSTALSVVVNTIGVDAPANDTYDKDTTIIERSTIDMNVDGSSTRQTFLVRNPFQIAEDNTRIMFMMETTAPPEMDKFGDQAALTRGLVFRLVNGTIRNHWVVKSNADLILLMHDVTFYEAAKHGANGLGGRLTYGGQSKHGVTLRLAQDEVLEMIIQDDLTGLLSFRVSASGHQVEGN